MTRLVRSLPGYRRAAERVRLSRAFVPVRLRREARAVAAWEAAGRPVPPPATVKRALIAEQARRHGLHTLVETGTHRAETVESMLWRFDRIVSIELDPALAERARRRLGRFEHVRLLEGDSSALLGDVVASLPGPALFWLDAHYSGCGTARGAESDTPVLQELDCILSSSEPHVVLVDDAREFTGSGDYPSIEDLRGRVERLRPGWAVEVRDDVIRITP